MNQDYSPIEITNDAVAFANSRFGKHYLDRLAKAKARYTETAQRLDLTDGYRAHMMTQAKTVQLELDYFTTATAVQDDPNLIQRLRDKANKRRDKDDAEQL